MTTPTCSRRRLARALTLTLAFAASACSEFLVAENPGAVEEPDVNNPAYLALIANGPIYAFQLAHTDVTYWNGQFTDELHNRAVFVDEGLIDRRELTPANSYINAFMYAPLQRARFLGEDAARRIRTILGDTASRDLRVARSLAYAGYGYTYLGEMMCTTPIDVGVPKTSAEIFADAVARFQESLRVADSAKAFLQAQAVPNAALIAQVDSVRFFALVGAARASLNMDDRAGAIAFAVQVPSPFEFRAYYTDNTTGQRNRTYERLTLGNNAYMLNTPFMADSLDPRVPRVTAAGTRQTTPLSPLGYSTFNNSVTAGGAFAPIMSVRIASRLEAEYVIAEAEGPVANTLTFVNARRAAGNQAPIAYTGDSLMAELRDQRRKDFYLDNHRLGDLRRYLQYYSINLFQQGPYPGSTSGQIFDPNVTCWPLPTNELSGNPNIP